MEIKTIRQLTSDDYEKNYLVLLRQLTDCPNLTKTEFVNKLQLIKKNPYHKIFVIEDHQIIIASVTILVEPKFIHHNQNVAHLEDFIIDQKYQNNGIGHKLLNYVINYAKLSGCYKLILNCQHNLINYYQKFNFVNKNQEMALYFS